MPRRPRIQMADQLGLAPRARLLHVPALLALFDGPDRVAALRDLVELADPAAA